MDQDYDFHIIDRELLRRAVTSATKDASGKRVPRWAAVMDRFGLGSSYAARLCRRFGLDPDDVFKAGGPSIQSKGGAARAAALTPERRREIATNASKARWAKKACKEKQDAA